MYLALDLTEPFSHPKNLQSKKNTNRKFQNLKLYNNDFTITYISRILQLHITFLYNHRNTHTLQLRYYNYILYTRSHKNYIARYRCLELNFNLNYDYLILLIETAYIKWTF